MCFPTPHLHPGPGGMYPHPYKIRQCTVYIIELFSTPGLNHPH